VSSTTPRQPSVKPINSSLYTRSPLRTTARMTAFRPGQSPPPVRTPTRIWHLQSVETAQADVWPTRQTVAMRRALAAGLAASAILVALVPPARAAPASAPARSAGTTTTAAPDIRARAELLRDGQHRDEAGLGAMRGRLDEAIAVDDARRAEAERAAEAARERALAAREGFLATARGRARAGLGADTPSPGGYDPVPLDRAALLPRHFAATAAQQALMARWPFGPIQPGAPLPAGLHPTGTHVEGIASWYGPDFDGRPTASGAIYDMEGWTIASPDLPLGSFLVVGNGDA